AVPGGARDPHDDPSFQSMKGAAKGAGARAKAHQPAAAGAATAQGAAVPPGNDVASQAAAAQVDEMGRQQPGVFDKKAFVAAVKKAIDAAAPKNLEEADEFKGSGQAGKAKDEVQGLVKGGKQESEKNIKQATEAPPDTSKATPKPVTPMVNDEPGAPPRDVGAAAAMPGKRPPEQTDLSAGPALVDSTMQDAGVTDEQIEKSNEPEFTGALEARDAARQHSDKAPGEYRAQEQDVLAKGRTDGEAAAAEQLAGMQGARVDALGKALGQKNEAKGADEGRRGKVAADIQGIYDRTKGDVTKILEALDGKVDAAFTKGEQAARTQFENYVDERMRAYKDDRYGGWTGGAKWLKDKLFGMPDEVNRFYEQGRAAYLTAMDGVIGEVADIVGTELTAARTRIADGRAEVQKYVAQLPADLREVGKEAEGKLESQFEQLSSDVDSKQDALVDTLAQKYVESRDALDARIEELQAANKGFVSKALDAVVGVVKTILKLKDMLLNVLARAASVIGDIIADPIGFLGNLVDGVKGGLSRFVDRIGTHLQDGLMGWLFGALGGAGITMPKTLDFAGILDLVLQILGLTYQNVRARLSKAVGEPLVARMERTVDVIKDFATKGIAGAWEWIKDKIGDLEDMVLGQIKEFITSKVIKAGITWIISLLNPAAAFIKACKAIYDIVMFIVERGAELMEFVNSVLDSIGAIAKGSIGAVVEKVEGALARALPLAISFLASLLGLGGISEKIRSIIDAVRGPINKAIDVVVGGAVKTFKKMFGGAIGWAKGKMQAGKEWVKGKVEAGKAWARGKAEGIRKRLTGRGEQTATPTTGAGGQATPAAEEPPAPMPEVVVPFDMDGEGHTLTVREAGDSVDVIMASEPLSFTSKIRIFHTELDDWRHYLESIRDRMPPDVQRQIDAKLKHLKNIRGTQISAYKEIYDRTYGNRRLRIEGHRDPDREREGLRALKDRAQEDAAALKAWAVESDIQDVSKAALDGSFRTLGKAAFEATLKQRRETVDGILGGFQTPNGEPVRYRGSLDEGKRNPSKAGVRFDPEDFDLDLYVVDPRWHAAILAARPALREAFADTPMPAGKAGGAALGLEGRVVAALEAPGAVPGLRLRANYILIRVAPPE
ncbi:MAG: phage tail protein, partial [Solirubrobacteraceae bacterium]